MGAMAYATTVISTHFVEGRCPNHIKYDPDKFSKSVKGTIEFAKKAFDAEEIHPINPNLVLSSDDTSLFVFEVSLSNNGDWEWTMVDKSQDSSVRSDPCCW